ncbi:hypothetical protein GGTG_09230 [Gaeumannomyces tritici R3-111a-1]|uniref:Uncharacterized protein n=1 Tax=Gaeumannomyces tritici (strain R3-111a-1) TaxID=644352 RepID=J3P6T8_GAET3|nr:hypothetical protein GGTG_09230 [Gaeumannomyces tritici R3-111a-1]EJT72364.1 hypothetical protein GGTG_09230 [Gaeumannomyces tritici R3-111a-1]
MKTPDPEDMYPQMKLSPNSHVDADSPPQWSRGRGQQIALSGALFEPRRHTRPRRGGLSEASMIGHGLWSANKTPNMVHIKACTERDSTSEPICGDALGLHPAHVAARESKPRRTFILASAPQTKPSTTATQHRGTFVLAAEELLFQLRIIT